jgi:hypothetical protein
MDNKKRFAPATVQDIQAALEALPPCEATEMSKQQAVQALSPQIDDLRGKGYGWIAIAAMVSERGLPISAAALRTYLRRGRTDAPAAKVRRSPKRSAQVAASASAPSPVRPDAGPTRDAALVRGAVGAPALVREGEDRPRGPAERATTASKRTEV